MRYLLLLILLLLSSCGDMIDGWDEVPETEQSGDPTPFPFGLNYYWEYADSSGTATVETALRSTAPFSYSDGTAAHSLCPVQWFDYSSGAYYPFSMLYEIDTARGLVLAGAATATDTLYQPSLYLKYPTHPGEEWTTYDIDYDATADRLLVIDTLAMSCIAVPVSVTTPVGTFSCIEYGYRRGAIDYRLYYALHYGFVAYRRYAAGVLIHEKLLTETTVPTATR